MREGGMRDQGMAEWPARRTSRKWTFSSNQLECNLCPAKLNSRLASGLEFGAGQSVASASAVKRMRCVGERLGAGEGGISHQCGWMMFDVVASAQIVSEKVIFVSEQEGRSSDVVRNMTVKSQVKTPQSQNAANPAGAL